MHDVYSKSSNVGMLLPQEYDRRTQMHACIHTGILRNTYEIYRRRKKLAAVLHDGSMMLKTSREDRPIKRLLFHDVISSPAHANSNLRCIQVAIGCTMVYTCCLEDSITSWRTTSYYHGQVHCAICRIETKVSSANNSLQYHT